MITLSIALLILLAIISSIYEFYKFASPSARIKSLKEKADEVFLCAENINLLIDSAKQLKSEIEIPEQYEIGEDELPRNKNSVHNWGPDFTVYLTPTGIRYHKIPHCSPNSYVENIVKATKWHSPCLICCKHYFEPDLEWYNKHIQYTEELSKIDSLSADLAKGKKELEIQRKILNNSYFTFMLDFSSINKLELRKIDKILKSDMDSLQLKSLTPSLPTLVPRLNTSTANTNKTTTTSQSSIIPAGVAIGKDGLPYVKMREYGYGKRFNAFVTKYSDCYHRSKCSTIRFHKKILMHRYEALKLYRPCTICKPVDHIERWYKQYLENNNQQKNLN